MFVTVWRHGEAGQAARDEDRALTERGIRTVSAAALEFEAWRADAGLPAVDVLRHSPLVRTTQTAGLLSEAFSVVPEPIEGLGLGANLHAPESFLPESGNHVVLVTHQPFVSQAVWYWLDDDALEPTLPGGWTTLELIAPSRGGGLLQRARSSVF